MDRAVGTGHMLCTGAVRPLAVAARMTGDPLTVAVEDNRTGTGLDLNSLFNQVVGHRVIMLVVLDVIVDVHTGLLDLGILLRLRR